MGFTGDSGIVYPFISILSLPNFSCLCPFLWRSQSRLYSGPGLVCSLFSILIDILSFPMEELEWASHGDSGVVCSLVPIYYDILFLYSSDIWWYGDTRVGFTREFRCRLLSCFHLFWYYSFLRIRLDGGVRVGFTQLFRRCLISPFHSFGSSFLIFHTYTVHG